MYRGCDAYSRHRSIGVCGHYMTVDTLSVCFRMFSNIGNTSFGGISQRSQAKATITPSDRITTLQCVFSLLLVVSIEG